MALDNSSPVPRLDLRDLSKTFGNTKVLDAVHLRVQPGEVHGLVGQNGSGKSTLVKILTGYHVPDSGGTLHVDGKPLRLPVAWRDAQEVGVSVVHQDFGLLDQLTVAENIGVGGFATHRLIHHIKWREQAQLARRVLERLQVELDPCTLVGTLTAAQRSEVAIARAMRDLVPGSGLVILDESTRALGRADRDRFHQILRRVVDEDSSVLMVSHDLEEILSVADRITVLRDGRLVGSGLRSAELDESELARLMLGKEITTLVTQRSERQRPAAVTVRALEGGSVAGVDLTIGEGEVVGLTGLPGNGFEEIPYLLSGARPASSGSLRIGDRDLSLARADVAGCIRAGVVLVPEQRIRDGLALELSVRDNVSLPTLRRRGRPWFVGRDWQNAETRDAIETLGIRPNAPTRLVKELSGGNQQKVLLAKWLTVGPKLLVLHEPTQAVDVGARQDLLRAVHRVAETGVAVLLTTVEAADLVSVCDRVIVYGGRSRLREIRTADPDEILEAAYSTNKSA
jgi:ribose transport system ATP-binding protein